MTVSHGFLNLQFSSLDNQDHLPSGGTAHSELSP